MSKGKLLALAGAIGLLLPAAAAEAKVSWGACGAEVPPGYQCAQVEVPLDHDDPRGTKIALGLSRAPATDPSRRLGSLLLNPGGPGGSGVYFVQGLGRVLLTDEVRARFDLVGFDPRGIAHSTALRCYGTHKQWAEVFTPFAYPESDADVDAWATGERRLHDACTQRGGRIAEHMSTADVARDMDLLRAELGDARLNFVGYSYGSYLGQTYAALFPQRVGRLVIDGVLDPVAWSTGAPGEAGLPFSTRLRSGDGSRSTLAELLRLCEAGGPQHCALAPGAAGRYDALRRALRARPLDGFDHRSLTAVTLGALYDPSGWEAFAQLLADLESGAAGAQTRASAAARAARTAATFIPKRGDTTYYNGLEGFPAVACSDSDNPDRYADWTAAARTAATPLHELWTWVTSVCAEWPFASGDRYQGPFTRRTAAPVLVVGTRHDPATPYHGAETARALLPNASLLTLEGWGHTSLFASACIDQAVERYLVSGQATDGQRCAADRTPFAG